MSLIEKSLAIALEAYGGKVDKAGHPYILHPLRVMSKMTDEISMAAAILHDVIEDSDINADDLRRLNIPEDVVLVVECLTRKKAESYAEFIDRIREPIARKIKLADIEDNLNVLRLTELTDADLLRVKKYHQAWQRLRYEA